jgi:NNP family nitrate/nitrite transporter-like MFS transporter
MLHSTDQGSRSHARALGLSIGAGAASFSAWVLLSIVGVAIKQEYGLTETVFGMLIAAPILVGALVRVMFGVWAEHSDPRRIFTLMLIAGAVAALLLSFAGSLPVVAIASLGLGVVGGAFAVAVAYLAKWYPAERQTHVLDLLGVCIGGAAITQLGAPLLMAAYGWRAVALVWAGGLFATAALLWMAAPEDPISAAERTGTRRVVPWLTTLEPLRRVQVWRFALYYFFLFGGFVALALWLPNYVVGAYGLDIGSAGLIAALFSLSAAVGRIYGGSLCRDYGARRIMYWAFGVATVVTFLLSYPATDYVMQGVGGAVRFHMETGIFAFAVAIAVLGFFTAIGQTAVYEHIPRYYPDHVGVVGGLVGMIGAFGGFVLPVLFGIAGDLMGVWQSCFMLLFVVVSIALVWMHVAIRYMEREVAGVELSKLPELPEMEEIHGPEHRGALRRSTRANSGPS